MTAIHPTAIVDSRAEIGAGVRIRAFAVVGAGVVLGDDCEVLENAIIRGPSTIGRGNVFFPHCVVGTDPQDLKYAGEDTHLKMGDGNSIREFVTVNRGTVGGGGCTKVGSRNLLMACSHVAHDCVVGDNNVLSNNVLLGGHIAIEDNVVLSGAAAVNHFVTIGTGAFVGGLTRIVQDVPPYLIVEGNPAKVRGVNVVRLERLGVPKERITAMWDVYKKIWKSDQPVRVSLEEIEAALNHTEEVAYLIAFLRRSESGEHGRYRETLRKS